MQVQVTTIGGPLRKVMTLAKLNEVMQLHPEFYAELKMRLARGEIRSIKSGGMELEVIKVG